MGNVQAKIPEPHIRMYQNLLGIKAYATRVQMIRTILHSPEHQESARIAGIYGTLLHYVQLIQSGEKPPLLPGEQSFSQGQGQMQNQTLTVSHREEKPVNEKGNERAMNYFSACLRILELEEEVALTADSLKAAYKKAVVRAHPDKGGSEKQFEAVTRAYAYLGEILKRIHGGRSTEGKVESPTALKGGRTNDADAWKMVEPVTLNPDKLDVNTFNTMFEKTRIPDPEESGYGDWLKGEESSAAPKFSGKFNRDVFHRAFEEETRAKPAGKHSVMTVQEQTLSNRLGYATELGRTGRDDYTVASHDSAGLKYTDLKKAYTQYNTFSQETSGITVSTRSLDQYSKDRDKAPAPLADHEMAAVVASEKAAKIAEEKRRQRQAEESVAEERYFERMKHLVVRNK